VVSTDLIIPPRESVRVYGGLHPLSNEHRRVEVPAGATIADALEIALTGVDFDWPPDRFVASVNGERVPREYWERVRPKPGTVVIFRPVTSGGDTLRSVLFLGVAIAAMFLAGPIGGAIGGFFATGTGTALIAGALTIGGAFLLNALIPLRPPQQDTTTGAPATLPMIAGAQNEARPWSAIPVVLGVHRLSPMYAAMPYTFFSGEKQFINLLFCCGYGPVQISSMRIGETPVTDFEEVTTEVREGRVGDAATSLFPSIANEQQLNINLKSTDGFVSRTTDANCSTISIDLIAPNGIYSYNSKTGKYDDRPVTVIIQYAVHGTGAWVGRPLITFTRTRDTVRKGDQWNVAPGTYDVRLQKVTADYVGTEQVADAIQWVTLRAFETGQPITFPKPLALVSMRARGSDQFNGVINTFNCVVASYVKSWNGNAWLDNQLSSNPADLFRHVLQGPANARPRTDAQLDLLGIQAWADDCRSRGYTYNAIISDARTVREVLADIAAAGRATVALRNGKWGVSFPRTTDPVSWHFTPRNSSGLKSVRTYRELPHALRVRYIEASSDWQQVEKIVYNDKITGGMYDAATATLFESVEFPGITDWENIHKAARFQLAQALLRPETHTLTADIESLRLERGDKVIVSADTLLIGTGFGRVVSVDSVGETVIVDSRVIMAVGKSYQIKFTLNDGSFLTRTVLNTANETDWIKFDIGDNPPIASLQSIIADLGSGFEIDQMWPEVVDDPSLPLERCVLETSLGQTELGVEPQLKEIERGLLDLLAKRPTEKA
jgi:sulfur carrier protein ThiS